jgi:hypothetical protein
MLRWAPTRQNPDGNGSTPWLQRTAACTSFLRIVGKHQRPVFGQASRAPQGDSRDFRGMFGLYFLSTRGLLPLAQGTGITSHGRLALLYDSRRTISIFPTAAAEHLPISLAWRNHRDTKVAHTEPSADRMCLPWLKKTKPRQLMDEMPRIFLSGHVRVAVSDCDQSGKNPARSAPLGHPGGRTCTSSVSGACFV